MTPEIWAIIGVGLALAGLIQRGQSQQQAQTADINKRLARISEISERLARLAGLIDGLRSAISKTKPSA